MNLDISFPALTSLVQKMEARPVSWETGQHILVGPDIREILVQGLEINIDEVEVSDNGLLTYQGEQILLYIKDTNKDEHTLLHETEKAPRFHLADCRTLDSMRQNRRFDRYVATRNTSGIFKADYHDWNTGERGETSSELKVCRNCLKLLNYKNYSNLSSNQKPAIHNDFDIEEFFETYSSNFTSTPTHTDETSPQSGYSDNWSEVSMSFRKAKKWKCSECEVDLAAGNHHRLLHVHHINGLKSDNQISNLKAVCVTCHAEEPSHGHMHIPPDDKALLAKLRQEQNEILESMASQQPIARNSPRGGEATATENLIRQEI